MSTALPHHRSRWQALLVAFLVAWGVQSLLSHRTPAPREIPYSELMALLHASKVVAVEIDAETVVATLRAPEGPGDRVRAVRLPGIEDKTLLDELRAVGVRYSGRIQHQGWLAQVVVGWILPMFLFYALWSGLARRSATREPA